MNKSTFFPDSVFFSYAQIFFCNRRWFGALALAATMIDINIGLMSLLGVVFSNMIAAILKFDSSRIRSGFYGFNGLLIGAAAAYYFPLSPQIVFLIPVFIIVTFLITAVIEHYFASAFNLPGLSLPFVISLYIFFLFMLNYPQVKVQYHDHYLSPQLPGYLSAYFNSLGLIVLQPNVWTGIIISAALLLFSRILFLLSVITFSLSYLLAGIILPAHSESTLVIICFNSMLVGFALGGSLIIPSRKSVVLASISTVLVIVMVGFFGQLLRNTGLPMVVLPFNFIVLASIYSLKFRQEQSDLTLLYFAPGSPEENHYYHLNRKSRFLKFKNIFPELPVFGEWTISQGFDGSHTHKDEWRYAWDFVVVDSENSQHSNDGNALSDYHCYKLPVVAPLDGKVVKVTDGIPNNKIGEVNLEKNWGNSVIIDHSEGLYSAISHLEPGSIKVKTGDMISKGAIIGACGSSGRSPYPHLHFQFQLSDTLGAHTYKFPIAHYLQKYDGGYSLKTFDFPEEDAVVQNIEIHKSIKKAFDFKLENKFVWKCTFKSEDFEETWEVKISSMNSLFVESSRGATVTVYQTPKVMYLTDFVGNRHSALYYFSLAASQVPLCYHTSVTWEDTFSPALFPGSIVRYMSEFFLLFTESFSAGGRYCFGGEGYAENDFAIRGQISVAGKGLFSFYRLELESKLIVNRNGEIGVIEIGEKENTIFRAEVISKKE